MTEVLRTYEIGFDQADGLEISRTADHLERQAATEKFYSYVSSQMETTIGERLNVGLSTISYDIKDGQMWGKDMNEPFVVSLKRGRDYRKAHGRKIDWAREEAEVEGFSKIQENFLSDKSKDGDMMLSVSLRGSKDSTYQRNFYDIFTLRYKDNGEKYIETRRYASALCAKDYAEKLGVFGSAEDFLANPIRMPEGLTPDDVHAYLHRESDFMNNEEFEVITGECRPLIQEYARALIEHHGNDTLHRILFNAIINKADDISEKLKKGKYNLQLQPLINVRDEVERYGFAPVKEIETGCGILGGYDVTITSPFGVVEYTTDNFGERSFNCPDCNKENIRPINQKIPFCKHCGSKNVGC